MSRRAILIIVLIIETLFPHLPLQPVQAAEKTDVVWFSNSWNPFFWQWSQTLSLPDVTYGVITLDITPTLCAGASIAVGWPFQFTGEYPETISARPTGTIGDQVKLTIDNQASGGSNPATCPNSNGQNNIFEAFAGLKAQVDIHLKIGPPHLPHLCDCCWCWDALICCPLSWVADALNWLSDHVFSLFSSIGIPTEYEKSWTWDLADVLGLGPTYMEMAWGSGESPISQTIGPFSNTIGPSEICPAPPFICGKGLLGVGFGTTVTLTPTVEAITGTPHVDDGSQNFVSIDDPGKPMIVGKNPGWISQIIIHGKKGEPPTQPNPLQFTITVDNLQQPISVSASLQPTLYFRILEWYVPSDGIHFATIDDPNIVPLQNLQGVPSLMYQSEIGPLTPADLTIGSVMLSPYEEGSKESYTYARFGVLVKNLGYLPTGDRWAYWAVYEKSNLLTKSGVYPSQPLQPYSAQVLSITIPLSALSQPLAGHHSLRFVINPDHTTTESRYDNNEYQYDLNLLPDLKIGFCSGDSCPPRSVSPCQTFTLGMTVANIGVVGAPPEGYASYAVYDTTAQGGTVQLAKYNYKPAPGPGGTSVWIPALAPGQQWTTTVWKGILSGLGSHQVTIVVNPDDAVEESEYDNNKWTFTINVVESPSCKGTSATITAQPKVYGSDFFITPRCYEMTITRGNPTPTTCAIDVTLISGTGTQPVTLTLTGLPAGVTASFSPISGNPSFHSTLTLKTTSTAPLGTYTLTLTGAGGGVSHSKTLTLKIIPVAYMPK